MRNEPPISTSWPRETTNSRPPASAAAAARRAAPPATSCGTPASEEASSSTDGSARRSGPGALGPVSLATLDLLLPDRRLGLQPVDDLARARERLAAVRRRRCHDHARLAQRHVAHAVLGGR